MRHLLLGLLALFALLGAQQADAAVFSLRPDSGHLRGGGSLIGGEQKVWEEAVLINGLKTKLRIDLCRDRSWALVAALARQYPGLDSRQIGGTTVVEIAGAKRRTRFLYIDAAESTLRFTMVLPEKLPSPVWPRELPTLTGAYPSSSIAFPERGTVTVQFEMGGPADACLSAAARELTSKGWMSASESVSGEFSNAAGGIYLSADGKNLISLGLKNDPGVATSSGVMIMTTLKNSE